MPTCAQVVTDRFYLDGAWTSPVSTSAIEVFDSTTEEVMAKVASGSDDDVDSAVSAARAAFAGWSVTSADARADYLIRMAAAIEVRGDRLSRMITRETGMPLAHSRAVQVGLPLTSLKQAADVARTYEFAQSSGRSLVLREPVGVVGCIAPWNYPLHQVVAKVAYAIAAGCTVVVKPSEIAPLDAFVLAEVVDEIGLPPGVFNLVCGTGEIVGEALASHPGVDMVSFTGSTRAGRRVAELGARTVKKLALELGGKSASLLLDDLSTAEFEAAVTSGVGNVLFNCGQSCSALSRMLVPRDRAAEAAEIAHKVVAAARVGDPFVSGIEVGPLASAGQRVRVQDYIQLGIDEGADLIAGGPGVPPGLTTGYFVRPTVFGSVRPTMRIAQEEIFGPVLSIMSYEDEDDAVDIANGVVYGLSGAVWSGNADRARRVAGRLRTGQVVVNGADADPAAPRGGYKQSGIGQEFGRHGFEEFLEIKSMHI